MRVLVVDDEPVARRVLREELDAFADVDVVGEADSGNSALELIASQKPDLVFLDLQMPGLNGFETVNRLGSSALPAIVILTAYDEFAIRAFEAGAVDYLLKPVSQARLKQSVDRVRRLLTEPAGVAESVAQLNNALSQSRETMPRPQKVVGKHGDEYFLLDVDNVLAFQADGDLTWILTAQRKYLATQNLKSLEERLGGAGIFRRIHRGTLVNINHIQKMSMLTSNRWLVTLSNGTELTVSRRQAKNVRDVLNW